MYSMSSQCAIMKSFLVDRFAAGKICKLKQFVLVASPNEIFVYDKSKKEIVACFGGSPWIRSMKLVLDGEVLCLHFEFKCEVAVFRVDCLDNGIRNLIDTSKHGYTPHPEPLSYNISLMLVLASSRIEMRFGVREVLFTDNYIIHNRHNRRKRHVCIIEGDIHA